MLKRAWWAKSPSAKWVGNEKPEEQDGSRAAWALDRRTDPLLGRTLTHWPEASQSGGPQTCNNTPQLLKEHQALNGKAIRTRFPPEPNGYLHLGHAKSMNMNFSLAFERLEGAGVQCKRETVFRYDDTNPEAETKEFIAYDLGVLRRFHAIGATRVHLTMTWVVSFSSLTAMPRAGRSRRTCSGWAGLLK